VTEADRLVLAESSHSKHSKYSHLSGRFWEKRTLRFGFRGAPNFASIVTSPILLSRFFHQPTIPKWWI
jgi:hypothetical protein